MTKEECEEILRVKRWREYAEGRWIPRGVGTPDTNRPIQLGKIFVSFGWGRWPRIRYSSLTPDIFKELIGAKK